LFAIDGRGEFPATSAGDDLGLIERPIRDGIGRAKNTDLTLTCVANCGALVSSGDLKVLIDALMIRSRLMRTDEASP